MVRTEDIWAAYKKCLKSKRNTPDGVDFVLGSPMKEIAEIARQINERRYVPYPSKCFVISRPKYREAFAAAFRDRIVQDWVMIRVEPLFESVYSDKTFNCRKGKGQLYGIHCLQDDVRRVSGDYTREAYIMKLDLAGYFMSIDREALARDTVSFIRERYDGEDVDDLCYVAGVIIRHDPTKGCIRRGSIEAWRHIPPHKSLFTCGEGKGVPIGNLTSQHTGNFRLYELDRLLDGLVMAHGRYVDDIYLVDRDKARLRGAARAVRVWLVCCGLRLNEKKTIVQSYTKGAEFTGAFVRGAAVLPARRVVRAFEASVRVLARQSSAAGVRTALPSVNSYLGALCRFAAFRLRRRTLKTLPPTVLRYCEIRNDYGAVALKKEYSPRRRMINNWRAAA